MELGSMLFGLFTVACFVVPVLYLQWQKKQEKKKFLQEFILIGKKQTLEFSQTDFWNHGYAIGIDAQKQKLLYLKRKEGKDQSILVDLAGLSSCRIINNSKHEKDTILVESILLSLSFQNSSGADKILEFYDKNESMAVYDELQLAEKWNAIINDQFKLRPLKPKKTKSEGPYLKSA